MALLKRLVVALMRYEIIYLFIERRPQKYSTYLSNRNSKASTKNNTKRIMGTNNSTCLTVKTFQKNRQPRFSIFESLSSQPNINDAIIWRADIWPPGITIQNFVSKPSEIPDVSNFFRARRNNFYIQHISIAAYYKKK